MTGDDRAHGDRARGSLAADALAGRAVVVVGAGMARYRDDDPVGNGKAIALTCAAMGAAVACVDRDPDAAGETAGEIVESGGRAVAIEADVSDPDDCERLVAESHERLGHIDGLVLNVGIGAGRGLTGTSVEQWDAVMDVNVRGHFLVARAAMPVLDDGSAIVFISSLAGYRPGSGLPVYDTSKAALEGLARFVARDGSRRGIRANIVAPGLIDTGLGRMATELRPGRAATPIPLGRQGTAWEVAQPVAFLLSDGARYITAQTLLVDGGLSSI